MFRSALCSRLLPPFGLGSVTIFDHAALEVSPSQKPAVGFPAQASSWGLTPDGIEWDQERRVEKLRRVTPRLSQLRRTQEAGRWRLLGHLTVWWLPGTPMLRGLRLNRVDDVGNARLTGPKPGLNRLGELVADH
jgi:hypothetical protein